MVEGGSKRLYVGNLFPDVTSDELKARFERFGAVESAEVKHKTDIDGNPIQTFAFVNIVASADSIDQCINALSNSKWKGYAVKVQQAKESFMSRLQRERQNKENWSQKPPPKPSDSYDPIALFKSNIPAEGENEGENNKTIKQPVQTKVPKGIKKSSANYEKLGSSDIGKEENGVIDFSGASNKKNHQPKGLKRKLQAYHSSDEEEGGEDAPIKKKKKPPVIGEGYDPLALLKGKKPGDSPSKRKKKFEEDGNKKEEKEQVKESMEEERQRNLDMINKIGKNEEEKHNKQENFKSRKENYDREKPRKKFEKKSTKNFMPRFDPEADTPEEFNAKLDGQGGTAPKYETISNLREIFGKSSVAHSSGFSFSFGFGSQQNDTENNHQTINQNEIENNHQTSKPKAAKLFQLENNDLENEDQPANHTVNKFARKFQSKPDLTNKFGVQLSVKSKSAESTAVEPFFVTSDDVRLKDAANLFYNDEVDVENVKNEFRGFKRHSLLQAFHRMSRAKKRPQPGQEPKQRGRRNKYDRH